MTDTGKPRTSFLIEDILSIKDSKKFNGKCSKTVERCSQWKEEKLSEQLCPRKTAFGVQTGERL